MKPRLQATLGQQLVMTPQLRQAIRLLQLSAVELEAEIAAGGGKQSAAGLDRTAHRASTASATAARRHRVNGDDGTKPKTLAPAEADWGPGDGETWYERTGPADRRRRRAGAPNRSPRPTPCTITCSGNCT